MNTQLSKLSILLSAILLTACGGGSDSGSGQNQSPDQSKPVTNTEGRLMLINDQVDRPELSLFDLEQQKVIDTKQLKTMPFAVHSSPAGRYGILMDRVGGTVNFYDGGLSAKGISKPELLNYQLLGALPTHYRSFNGQAAIFYDGNETTTSKFDVFTDANIGSKSISSQTLPFKHHGVAEPLGDYVLSTYLAKDQTKVSIVKSYLQHGDHFHEEQTLNTSCPGLHGASSIKGYSAFGCEDGVLVVEHAGNKFTNFKLPLDVRVGTVVGQANAAELVGLASATPDLLVINGQNKRIQRVQWTKAADVKRLTQGFSQSAQWFAVFDSLGEVVIFDTKTWQVKHRVAVINSSSDAVSKAALVMHGQKDHAFVNDVKTKQIFEINLQTGQLVRTINLSAVPQKFTWLGLKTNQ